MWVLMLRSNYIAIPTYAITDEQKEYLVMRVK